MLPMPPARVRKVILRLSKPSTPDTPAATPAAMPVPLPPLGLQQAPPTSPTPPPPLRPPNQLPSNAGLPIPNNSQHSVGTQENLLTYVPPHAGMFYPPVPAYPQHPPPFPPYGGINAVQPWTYTQYTPQQLAELSRRFPVHPLAIEHATVGGGDSLTHEARGRVANGCHGSANRSHGKSNRTDKVEVSCEYRLSHGYDIISLGHSTIRISDVTMTSSEQSRCR
jgi:hypothetical protein